MTDTLERPHSLHYRDVDMTITQSSYFDRYMAICRKVGYRPTEACRAEVMVWCFKNNVPLYDEDQVYKYLGRLAVREKARTGNHHHVTWASIRHYHETIPTSVIDTIGRVIDYWPEATFEVGHVSTDPFLRVAINGQYFIIGAWEEPGFSG